jgi:hypothetical protein
MKTLILASVFVLVVAETQKIDPKYDPWAKMPVSIMVDDRRDEVKMADLSVKRFWERLDEESLKGQTLTWWTRDRR